MKREILAILFALTVVFSTQSSEARNPVKGCGGGSSPPPVNSVRLLGNFDAQCNTAGSQASSRYQNISGVGPVVHLVAKKNGIASVFVKGLNNSPVTMLGSIQFTVTGATGANFAAIISFLPPGEVTPVTKFFSVSNGRIKSAGNNLYYIAVQDILNTVIIPPGSRFTSMQFLLDGLSGTQQVTSNFSNLFFTGFGGVGYDVNDPSDSCGLLE